LRHSLFCQVKQRTLVFGYRHFGVTYQPDFQRVKQSKQLNCLTLEEGTNILSRNVFNYQPTLRNILEEQMAHVSLYFSEAGLFCTMQQKTLCEIRRTKLTHKKYMRLWQNCAFTN
jgi:hypothetical protein